jgi:hypothetical protein
MLPSARSRIVVQFSAPDASVVPSAAVMMWWASSTTAWAL